MSATPGAGPSAPASLSAGASGSAALTLSWPSVSGAVSYTVYRGQSAGGEGAAPLAQGVSGASYSDTTITLGQKYYYKVCAVSSSGAEGGRSAEAVANCLAVPTSLSAQSGSTQVSLAWGQVAGVVSYNLYRSATAGGEGERVPVHLYLDEFETMATEQFQAIVAEGRRFGLGLCLSHQNLSQLPAALRHVLLNNVHTQLYFQTGAGDATDLAREIVGAQSAEEVRQTLMTQGVLV